MQYDKINHIGVNMKNIIKRKDIAIVAVISWMALIFYLSNQPASTSSELSGSIVQFFISLVSWLPITVDSHMLHFLIRKSAHFVAYFILGLLTFHAVQLYKGTNVHTIMMASLIAVVYAISDEFHQTFIPGRSGEMRDVIIDSAGSLIGIIAYICFITLYQRFKKA